MPSTISHHWAASPLLQKPILNQEKDIARSMVIDLSCHMDQHFQYATTSAADIGKAGSHRSRNSYLKLNALHFSPTVWSVIARVKSNPFAGMVDAWKKLSSERTERRLKMNIA
jgi:hypothetical protein